MSILCQLFTEAVKRMLGLNEHVNFDLCERGVREEVNFSNYYYIFETSTSLGRKCYSPTFFQTLFSVQQ